MGNQQMCLLMNPVKNDTSDHYWFQCCRSLATVAREEANQHNLLQRSATLTLGGLINP